MTRAAGALLALAAAAAALTGCGGGAKASRRDDLNRYVRRVNGIQSNAAAAWGRAETALGRMGTARLTDRELRGLASAPQTIRTLRGRIAAVTPPPEARRLHRLLLRLLDLDARFADDVALFGSYLHDVAPIETRLGADTTAFRAAVARTRARSAQEAALTLYVRRLTPLVARLQALRPPSALAPWHAEHLRQARRLVAAARELRLGLQRNDRAAESRGLAVFRDATAQPAVTAADRRAIVGYDARLAELRRLSAAVAAEQTRLAKELE